MAASGRTLKITIEIDSTQAMQNVAALQKALGGLAGTSGGRGGSGGSGGGGKAGGSHSDIQDDLDKAMSAGPKAVKAAQALKRALTDSVQPFNEEVTKTFKVAQREISSTLAAARKAGGGDQLISDRAINTTKARIDGLGKAVGTTVSAIKRDMDTINAKPTVAASNAFKQMTEVTVASGQRLAKSYKDLIEVKKRYYAGDENTSRADVDRAQREYASALSNHTGNMRLLKSTGEALKTSARDASATAQTLATNIANAGAASERARGNIERLGTGIKTSMERVNQNVADIGAAPERSISVALENIRKKAEREYTAVQNARKKAFDTKVAYLKGDATGADVAAAFGNLNRLSRQLSGTLTQLGQTQRSYEQSTARSAEATYRLSKGLLEIGRSADVAKRSITSWGDQASRQVERVKSYIAAKGVGSNRSDMLAFNIAGSGLDKALRDYRTAVEDAAKVKERFLKGDATGAEVKAAYDKVGVAARGVQTAYRGVTESGDKVIASTKKLSAVLNDHQQRLDQARRSAYAWSIAGYQMQATFGVMTQKLRDSVTAFAEFDFSVRRAAGSLGIFDQTGAAFDQLGSAVANTAIATKLFDPNEVAKGYYYWGSTTGQVVKTQEDLLAVQNQVIPVMQLAAITQTELETALKGVYSVMQQYGMPIENAEAVTQKLFLVSQKTAAEFPDLIESFKMVGPVANQLGISFDDVVGMLGALSNAGVKGGTAGRALRQTFTKLTDPTVRASAALDEAAAAAFGMGKSFDDIIFPEGEFIGMQGYLDVLSKMTADLTQKERGRLLGIITTQNELASLTQLVTANTRAMRSNKAGVIDQARSMYSAEEAATNFGGAVENQLGSAQATLKQFSAVAQSSLIELGKNVWSIIGGFVKFGVEVAKAFLTLMQTNKAFAWATAAVVVLAGVIVGLISTMLIAAGATKLLHAVFAFDLIPSFQKLITSGGTLANILLRLTLALQSTATANAQLNATNATTATGIRGMGTSLRALGSRLIGLAKTPQLLAVALVALVAVSGAANFAERNIAHLTAAKRQLNREIQTLVKRLIDFKKAAADEIYRKLPPEFAKIAAGVAAANDTFGELSETILKAVINSNNLLRNLYQLAKFGVLYLEVKDKAVKDQATKYGQTFRDFQSGEREEAGRPAAEAAARAQSMADSAIRALRMRMASGIGPAITAAFKSGNAAYADAAVEGVMFYMDAQTKAWGEALDKSVAQMTEAQATRAKAAQNSAKGLVSGLTSLLESDNSLSTALGAMLSGDVAKAFAAGAKSARPAVDKFLTTIGKEINSTSKDRRNNGRSAMLDFLNGMTSMEGLSEQQAAALGTAITLLATPGMELAGYNLAVALLKELGITLQNEIPKRISAARNASEYDDFGRTPGVYTPPAYNPGPSRPTDTTGSGSEQTPLEKALDVARQAADLAENLQKVAGKDIKAMVKSSMGKIAEAVVLADDITYNTTKSFSKAKLKAVAEFSENSEKVMALISAATDAFDSLTRFKKVPAKAFTDLKSNIVSAVNAIKAAADSFKNADALAKTIVFAEQAEQVMTTIGTALDVFAKMPASYDVSPKKLWNNITLDIAQVVSSLAVAATKVRVDVVGRAKEFGLSANDALEAVSNAVDLFLKVQDLGDYKRAPKALWNEVTADIAQAVDALGRASSLVKPSMTDKARTFAESIGEVIGVLSNAVDLFGKIPSLIDLPDGSIFSPIATRIGQMATSLGEASATVDKGLLAAAKTFAEKVGPVVSVIGTAVGALKDVASFVMPDASQVTNVVVTIRNVMEAMAAEIDTKKFNTKTTDAISRFSNSAVDALNAIKTANEVFAPTVQDLVEMGTKMVVQPPEVATSVKWIVDVMNAIAAEAVKFPQGVTDSVTRMTTAAAQVIDAVKSFYDIIAPQDLSQAGVTQMQTNIAESIKIALAAIKGALQPFVDGFKVTGGDIVKNLVIGINSEIPALIVAIAAVKALIKELSDAWTTYNAMPKVPGTTTPSKPPGKAMGGPVSMGQTFLVGERGPELFVPAQNGTIIPSVSSATAEMTITHVVKGDVSGLTATQLAAMLNSSMGSLATAIATSSKR